MQWFMSSAVNYPGNKTKSSQDSHAGEQPRASAVIETRE